MPSSASRSSPGSWSREARPTPRRACASCALGDAQKDIQRVVGALVIAHRGASESDEPLSPVLWSDDEVWAVECDDTKACLARVRSKIGSRYRPILRDLMPYVAVESLERTREHLDLAVVEDGRAVSSFLRPPAAGVAVGLETLAHLGADFLGAGGVVVGPDGLVGEVFETAVAVRIA